MHRQLALSSEYPDPRVIDHVEGIGLIRGEYIFRRKGEYITRLDSQRAMKAYLTHLLELFANKPVWYRFCDAPANEINMLAGNDQHILEEFPTIGVRGMRRALICRETFATEFNIIAELARKYPNLHIIFPYISELAEVEFGLEMVKKTGFGNKVSFMIETPAAVYFANTMQSMGVNHFLVGMNDLSSLVVGASRGSQFDRKDHPALLGLLQQVRRDLPHASLSVAGYIDAGFYNRVATLGFDHIVIHYSSLQQFLPDDLSDYAEINFMDQFKREDNRKRLKQWSRDLMNAAESDTVNGQGLQWRPATDAGQTGPSRSDPC